MRPMSLPLRRPFLRRAAWTAAGLTGVLLVSLTAGGLWLRHTLVESLPQLDGERPVAGLQAPVSVVRDGLGIPTLRGESRRDVAYATGFVHAQDRFFLMDLLRRRSAGELAELFGEQALPADRTLRIHLFRKRSRTLFEQSPADVRSLLTAYADGVNAGLEALGGPPFEYAILREEAQPWQPEDSFLVLFSMFTQLQDFDGVQEQMRGLMRDRLPGPLVSFLLPEGTGWDAPLVGPAFDRRPPIPGPEVVDLRRRQPERQLPKAASLDRDERATAPAASNSWAVAGTHTAHGGALLANELHLGLAVPNLWYRAVLEWPKGEGSREWHRTLGVTLPGTPALVVGSNGQVAWGLTNSAIDTSDIVLLEPDPRDGNRYLVPGGSRRFEQHRETLRFPGGSEEVSVDWTIWGPVLGTDHRGRKQVVRSILDLKEAVDFSVLDLETATDVSGALSVARRSGVPAMSFVVADARGQIAWTIIGRMPRRSGFDGRFPSSWADGRRRWEGLLPPEEVPVLVNPAVGRVWTGNNRLVDGDMLAKLGHDGYFLGARARQVRDNLLAIDRATTADMLKIQLDDRAVFLERWRELLLSVLDSRAVAADPRRGEIRDLVEHWGGRATIDSVGYRVVRSFRLFTARDVFAALTAPCREVEPDFSFVDVGHQLEGPLWQLVSQRPVHLLDPRHETWNDQLLAVVDQIVAQLSEKGALRERTWGERNTSAIRHPLSSALPGLGAWLLDMPAEPLPGDEHMPRVQDPSYGSTLRMVVSPGRESEGLFHMPGGQSGHPLSPHYKDGHAAWAQGAATPLLPGPPLHRLRLLPRQHRGRAT